MFGTQIYSRKSKPAMKLNWENVRNIPDSNNCTTCLYASDRCIHDGAINDRWATRCIVEPASYEEQLKREKKNRAIGRTRYSGPNNLEAGCLQCVRCDKKTAKVIIFKIIDRFQEVQNFMINSDEWYIVQNDENLNRSLDGDLQRRITAHTFAILRADVNLLNSARISDGPRPQ